MATKNSISLKLFVISRYPYVMWGLQRLIDSQLPTISVVGYAKNCAEGLERLGEADPRLILLDTDPKHDDAIAAIPRLSARSLAKVLVLTGARDDSLHDDAVLAGASGVVSKQASPATILSALEKVHDGQLWLDRISTGRIVAKMCAYQSTVDPERSKISSLSGKENVVMALVANNPGASGKTLARMLNVSEKTVRNHLNSMYRKLNLPGRFALYVYAHRYGLFAGASPIHNQTAVDPVLLRAPNGQYTVCRH